MPRVLNIRTLRHVPPGTVYALRVGCHNFLTFLTRGLFRRRHHPTLHASPPRRRSRRPLGHRRRISPRCWLDPVAA
jgi:hypothetical protein